MIKKFSRLSLVMILWFAVQVVPLPTHQAVCRIIFMDVGQGDAILIQTPDHQDMLIDGGPSDQVVKSLPKYLGPGNRNLELVVLTHPDSDHIRGLVSVIERFEVRQVFRSDVETTTAIFQAWNTGLTQHQILNRTVSQAEKFQLGEWLKFQILWPPAGKGWQFNGGGTPTNDASVSLHLTCAGSTAVLTGDASDQVENRILRSGLNVNAWLLKAGHHGSRTSNSHAWLKAVDPQAVVISVGRDNHYGHPHPTVLERFTYAGLTVWRTDTRGDIVLETDGGGGWKLSP